MDLLYHFYPLQQKRNKSKVALELVLGTPFAGIPETMSSLTPVVRDVRQTDSS